MIVARRSLALAAMAALATAGLPALPARAAATGVAADLAGVEAALKRCLAKDDSNLGMKMCTADADTAADRILNRVYGTWTAQLKAKGGDTDAAETLKRLQEAERAWIAFRDADCSLQGTTMLGGSGEDLAIVTCRLAMTEGRARSLDALRDEP